LTAADSVYAYQVASDPATPVSKHTLDQTFSYTIVDDTTIKWVGKPGLVTDAFEDYFWPPMPEHAWGKYSAEEMLEAEEVTRSPLGWGAYVIEEWQPGEFIRLRKNPIYFRMIEGLPKTDIINFEFINGSDSTKDLASANTHCDFISSTALDLKDIIDLSTSAPNTEFDVYKKIPAQLKMLAFGITPYSYDDTYYPFGGQDRPDFFGDERVRQAIAHCIDRDTINNKLLGGAVETGDAVVPKENALMTGLDLATYAYDPTTGISLLEQVGWVDQDRDPTTPITASNVFNVPSGTSFEVELLTSGSSLRSDIAREIAAGLLNCGIQVNITQLSASEIFKPGPEGHIFGRKFDLALLSWKTNGQLDCLWFMSGEIPSDANYWLGEKTGGANFYGISDGEFDTSCASAQQPGLDIGFSMQADQKNIQLLNQHLPFVTIYHLPGAYLVKNVVDGIEYDSINPFSSIELIFTSN
jgi:peptide/nickel transport system substrate-binding protein